MSAPAAVNRASRLYEVLRDGRVHSREEIFRRAGFMLTNNAASELRDQLEPRGLNVVHTVEHRVNCYQIVALAGEVEAGAASTNAGNGSGRFGGGNVAEQRTALASTSSLRADSLEQLTLDAA